VTEAFNQPTYSALLRKPNDEAVLHLIEDYISKSQDCILRRFDAA